MSRQQDMNENPRDQHLSTSTALDDEQRVRVLSPAMLVFKRFIRNKLAITGTIFIAGMFLFSFVGGWLMPYGESEVFTRYVDMSKDYAGASRIPVQVYDRGRLGPMIARSSSCWRSITIRLRFQRRVDYTLRTSARNSTGYRRSGVATAAMIGEIRCDRRGRHRPGTEMRSCARSRKRDALRAAGRRISSSANSRQGLRFQADSHRDALHIRLRQPGCGHGIRIPPRAPRVQRAHVAGGGSRPSGGHARYELALGMATYTLSGEERIVYANISGTCRPSTATCS